MHKFLPTFVIALLILLMLSYSAAHTFAEQNGIRLVLSARTNSNSSVRVKQNTSAKPVTKTSRVKNTAPTPTPKKVVPIVETKQTSQSTQTPSNTPTPIKSGPTPPIPPEKTETISDAGLSEEQKFIMQAINDYRAANGLSPVKPDKYTCDFAATRAQEIGSNFSHDGFRQRIDSKSLTYPSYALVTENIAMTSDYKQVVQMWINSSGHAENMRKDTPLVCVARHDTYYAYEGWRP